jgi:hemin uptake protein HemP
MRTVDELNDNNYRYLMQQAKTTAVQRSTPPAKVASEVLLGERRELVITHNGREYRLRVTQNGKLILTA